MGLPAAFAALEKSYHLSGSLSVPVLLHLRQRRFRNGPRGRDRLQRRFQQMLGDHEVESLQDVHNDTRTIEALLGTLQHSQTRGVQRGIVGALV